MSKISLPVTGTAINRFININTEKNIAHGGRLKDTNSRGMFALTGNKTIKSRSHTPSLLHRQTRISPRTHRKYYVEMVHWMNFRFPSFLTNSMSVRLAPSNPIYFSLSHRRCFRPSLVTAHPPRLISSRCSLNRLSVIWRKKASVICVREAKMCLPLLLVISFDSNMFYRLTYDLF